MHLIFSFWTASSQADPLFPKSAFPSAQLLFPAINICIMDSGPNCKTCVENFCWREKFSCQWPSEVHWGAFSWAPGAGAVLVYAQLLFHFCKLNSGSVCGLSLEQKCFSQPCVSCSLGQAGIQEHLGLLLLPSPEVCVFSAVSCQVRADGADALNFSVQIQIKDRRLLLN